MAHRESCSMYLDWRVLVGVPPLPCGRASKKRMLGSKSTLRTRDCKILRAVNLSSRFTFFAKVIVIRDDILLFPRGFGTLRVRKDLSPLGVSTKKRPQRPNGCWADSGRFFGS